MLLVRTKTVTSFDWSDLTDTSPLAKAASKRRLLPIANIITFEHSETIANSCHGEWVIVEHSIDYL